MHSDGLDLLGNAVADAGYIHVPVAASILVAYGLFQAGQRCMRANFRNRLAGALHELNYSN